MTDLFSDVPDVLIRKRKNTPNVPTMTMVGYRKTTKSMSLADQQLRSIAQNIIEEIDEHRHLRHARVLLLVVSSEATERKLKKGERVVIGRASPTTDIMRMMTTAVSLAELADSDSKLTPTDRQGYDFIVKLSADWLSLVGYETGDVEALGKACALIDHELLHCGVKIAGQFVPPIEIEKREADLGERFVEARRDVTNDKGEVLIRYQMWDEGKPVWKMRDHDVQEFCGVVARWGAWDRSLGQLIDVLETNTEEVEPCEV